MSSVALVSTVCVASTETSQPLRVNPDVEVEEHVALLEIDSVVIEDRASSVTDTTCTDCVTTLPS